MTAADFVVTTAEAETDIEDIVLFIAADSEQSAEKFALEFKEARERIRAFPEMARKVLPRRNLRMARVSARFWQYLIVYRYENYGVHILRVLQGAVNIPAQLRKLPR